VSENWKDIAGYEGHYQISDCGRVKSLKFGAELILAQAKTNYLSVSLWLDGKLKVVKVHRLVAEAFIPNMDNKPQVNHLDGNKFNNKVENLEWATRSENANHALALGLMPKGLNHKNAKVDHDRVHAFHLSNPELSQAKIANVFGVCQSLICRILKRKREVIYGN